ncbi:hypothetical protein HN51_048563 [Arachis hypogaea]
MPILVSIFSKQFRAHGLAPEIPEDLYHLIKKAVSIRKHLERNRKDKDSKFKLILVESRIHRITRYYKKSKKLPPVERISVSKRTWLAGVVRGLALGVALALALALGLCNHNSLRALAPIRIRPSLTTQMWIKLLCLIPEAGKIYFLTKNLDRYSFSKNPPKTRQKDKGEPLEELFEIEDGSFVVAGSFGCLRRTVLDERLKCNEYSTTALTGTLLHQIFQVGLTEDNPSIDFLEGYTEVVLLRNIENLYACGVIEIFHSNTSWGVLIPLHVNIAVNESDVRKTLIDAVPRILSWILRFTNKEENEDPNVCFGFHNRPNKVTISEASSNLTDSFYPLGNVYSSSIPNHDY